MKLLTLAAMAIAMVKRQTMALVDTVGAVYMANEVEGPFNR